MKRYFQLIGGRWYVVTAAVFATALFFWEDLHRTPDGRHIFEREKCIDCHSFKGRGGAIGPDLTAVKDRRSEEWIRDQIHHPEKHNPDTRMPSFGHLSRREIRAIVKFFKD